ncbi:peptidase M22 [Rariglobus hedericola]|uniref:Peptidase M22 n=1 Tax=Rariglobus hedericola TaxID=2597822 RepID=A0A556QPZ2_9BACT|nr:peptidase M22 [Rariglobus hedericola]TSJ78706.1 peptidase M22 [Rariglobus hedericola]
MPSLRQLLAEHPTLLLIDTTSARVQIGLWENGESRAARWKTSDTEASTGLFDCVESLLSEADLRIADIKAFVFCEGPGSVLGIRTAAVALRSWRVLAPASVCYRYQSLDLVARALNQPESHIIADARRDTWHVARIGEPLKRVPTAELRGELIMPEFFRHWTPLPAGVTTTRYAVNLLFMTLMDAELFQPSSEPDAFMHEDPTYVTWSPQVHQAPRTS